METAPKWTAKRIVETLCRLVVASAAGWAAYGAIYGVTVPPLIILGGCVTLLWMLFDVYNGWRTPRGNH